MDRGWPLHTGKLTISRGFVNCVFGGIRGRGKLWMKKKEAKRTKKNFKLRFEISMAQDWCNLSNRNDATAFRVALNWGGVDPG
jgi:hypothetical protein